MNVVAPPHTVDQYVGFQIRRLRLMRGLTQSDLAKAVSVTFQQMQKYERASNRVSASRLAAIAAALDAPIETFFPARGPSTGSTGFPGNHPLYPHWEDLTGEDRRMVIKLVRRLAGPDKA